MTGVNNFSLTGLVSAMLVSSPACQPCYGPASSKRPNAMTITACPKCGTADIVDTCDLDHKGERVSRLVSTCFAGECT